MSPDSTSPNHYEAEEPSLLNVRHTLNCMASFITSLVRFHCQVPGEQWWPNCPPVPSSHKQLLIKSIKIWIIDTNPCTNCASVPLYSLPLPRVRRKVLPLDCPNVIAAHSSVPVSGPAERKDAAEEGWSEGPLIDKLNDQQSQTPWTIFHMHGMKSVVV